MDAGSSEEIEPTTGTDDLKVFVLRIVGGIINRSGLQTTY